MPRVERLLTPRAAVHLTQHAVQRLRRNPAGAAPISHLPNGFPVLRRYPRAAGSDSLRGRLALHM